MSDPVVLTQTTCFVEADPNSHLGLRAAIEGVGSCLLMLIAGGSGLAAQHLHADPPVSLFLSALSIAGALVGLMVAFGPISGGHFNPLITGLQWLLGQRNGQCTAAYIAAQTIGALLGGAIANSIFAAAGGPALAGLSRGDGVASEIVASAGLMAIVFGCMKAGRTETGPFAVGAWLAAAIIATPSGSYANPAITLGSIVVSGPISLPWDRALVYVAAQCGAIIVLSLVLALVPKAPISGSRVWDRRPRSIWERSL